MTTTLPQSHPITRGASDGPAIWTTSAERINLSNSKREGCRITGNGSELSLKAPAAIWVARVISNSRLPSAPHISARPVASERTILSTPPTLGAQKWEYRRSFIWQFLRAKQRSKRILGLGNLKNGQVALFHKSL